MAYKYAYMNCTGSDQVCDFHSVIMKAIANDGKFDDDFSDIFVLTKTPEGSDAEYALNFV